MSARTAFAIAGFLACTACHRHPSRTDQYVQSLRCGMSRAEVSRLAHRYGYGHSDASWLKRSTANEKLRTEELMLVDLTFRQGRLVSIREGRYDPRTKQVTYTTVDLCSTPR